MLCSHCELGTAMIWIIVPLKKVPACGSATKYGSQAGRVLIVLNLAASKNIELVPNQVSNSVIRPQIFRLPFSIN